MEYGRKLAVWGWGSMIALGFLVLFLIIARHLSGWTTLLLLAIATTTISVNTSLINRRHARRLAAATTEPIEY